MASEFSRHASLEQLTDRSPPRSSGAASCVIKKLNNGNPAGWGRGLVHARLFAYRVGILGGNFGITDALNLIERRDTHPRGFDPGVG